MKNLRHRRLHGFFKSKVLNMLMIAVITGLFLMAYTKSMLLPVMCSSLALAFFVGYSLWLWIKKPKSVTTNELISSINGFYTFYYLIIVGLDTNNDWCLIAPIVIFVAVLFIALVNKQDEVFEI